jgi:hypothetical protein
MLSSSLTAVANQDKSADKDIQKIEIPGISFYQVNFLWEYSTYINSSTGQLIVDIETLTSATGLQSGYINVYSDQGWIIQNLIIIDDFPYETICTYFDLGDSGEITTLNVYIEATSEPTDRFSSGPYSTYPVYDIDLYAEGDEFPMTDPQPQPPSPGVPGPDEFNPIGANYTCLQSPHPNIEEAWNQCVPGAWSNNMQYLEDTYGVFVPHDHILGVNGTPSNSLVGQLDVVMGRPAWNRTSGKGTNYSTALMGVLYYAWINSLQVDFHHQEWDYGQSQDYTNGNYTSYGFGEPTFDFIYNEICKGSAVGLGYRKLNQSTGEKTGGHFVQLIAAGGILDVPFIIFLDDRKQGNDYAGTGDPQMRYLIDIDSDGWYNLLGEPGDISGFPPEVIGIYAMEAQNHLPEKPSPPLGPLKLKKEVNYEFTSSTIDPDGHTLWYLFDWGDGTDSGWVGPFDSGEIAKATHAWDENGLYQIRVKARDIFNAESEWSNNRIKPVPGFEMLLAIIGLIIVFYILKRNK